MAETHEWIATLLTTLLGVMGSLFRSPFGRKIYIRVLEPSGKPAEGIKLIGRAGKAIAPNRDGVASLPRDWIGFDVYITDDSGTRIYTFCVKDSGDQVQEITITPRSAPTKGAA